jgi:hypothetical protein
VNDEWYKDQVETKHRERVERMAREAQEKAKLAAAAKTPAPATLEPPAATHPNLQDFNRRREIAERARRGEKPATAPAEE